MAGHDEQDRGPGRSGHRFEDIHIHDRTQLGDTYHISKFSPESSKSNYASPPAPTPRFYNKYYELPGNPSSVFTGRRAILDQLERSCLLAEPSNTQQQQDRRHYQQKRFVIYGLEGCGKSQLCLKFAEEHREQYWGIFWIDATNEGNIQRGLSNISKMCGLEDDVGVVRRWLSNLPESWMLILDNVKDPDLDLSKYFPLGNRGTILITSRNPECRIYATVGVFGVGPMEEEEAITLMLKTIRHEGLLDEATHEKTKLVVLMLGCIPVAIDQAGGVIGQDYYTMEGYPKAYSHRLKELLKYRPHEMRDDHAQIVLTTRDISIRDSFR